MDKLEEYTVPQINSSLDQLALEKVSQGQIDILKPLFDNLSIPEVRLFIYYIDLYRDFSTLGTRMDIECLAYAMTYKRHYNFRRLDPPL